MSRDIRDRLQLFLAGELYQHGKHWTLKRIALTRAQITEYSPPPNPAKITDSRATAYIAQHGNNSWELDALPPDALVDLVRAEVEAVRDGEKWKERVEAESEMKELLTTASDQWPEVEGFLDGEA